ncbi:MAG: hypothetical protein M1132_10925 [Chloroflexi bacterium]|nr:hypothetical protein [Chloroflexota bacterium]
MPGGVGPGIGGSGVAQGAGVEVGPGATTITWSARTVETVTPPGIAVGSAGRMPSPGLHPVATRRKSADASALQPIRRLSLVIGDANRSVPLMNAQILIRNLEY